MPSRPLSWDDVRLFLAVAEGGSVSQAARSLQLGQATVSRRLADMELSVGEPLVTRRAQGCELTAAGERLLPAAQRMAEWAQEAEIRLMRPTHRLEGKVRIAAAPGPAFELLAPLAGHLRQSAPGLQLEVLAGVETLSLARGEAELSLRLERPNSAELLTLAELRCPLAAYASPDYARQLPERPRPEQVDWIVWAPPYEHLPVNQALAAAIPDFRPVFSSDDYLVQLAACRAGVGAMVLAVAPHAHALTQGLVRLALSPGPTVQAELFLVAHRRAAELPRTRFVAEALGAILQDLQHQEAG
ncbi:LysR family transcriptional regulator [Roseateles flavus]|uniref:LysR family transcriptional regulator n=1 Tax=Roseateles flavus TaxID=3149041 RepID=A0ABV0GAC5_9BURK